jgi:hypothetical protein
LQSQKLAVFAAKWMRISRLGLFEIAAWQTFAAVTPKKKRPHLSKWGRSNVLDIGPGGVTTGLA